MLKPRILRLLSLGLLLLAVFGGRLEAQFEAGSLYGTVADTTGDPLRGVTITLTGDGSQLALVTGADGRIDFPQLAPGNYKIRAEHKDFGTIVYRTVEILVGRTTSIHMQMGHASGEERVITS